MALENVLSSHRLLDEAQANAFKAVSDLGQEVTHLDFEPSEWAAENHERAATELARQFAEKS